MEMPMETVFSNDLKTFLTAVFKALTNCVNIVTSKIQSYTPQRIKVGGTPFHEFQSINLTENIQTTETLTLNPFAFGEEDNETTKVMQSGFVDMNGDVDIPDESLFQLLENEMFFDDIVSYKVYRDKRELVFNVNDEVIISDSPNVDNNSPKSIIDVLEKVWKAQLLFTFLQLKFNLHISSYKPNHENENLQLLLPTTSDPKLEEQSDDKPKVKSDDESDEMKSNTLDGDIDEVQSNISSDESEYLVNYQKLFVIPVLRFIQQEFVHNLKTIQQVRSELVDDIADPNAAAEPADNFYSIKMELNSLHLMMSVETNVLERVNNYIDTQVKIAHTIMETEEMSVVKPENVNLKQFSKIIFNDVLPWMTTMKNVIPKLREHIILFCSLVGMVEVL